MFSNRKKKEKKKDDNDYSNANTFVGKCKGGDIEYVRTALNHDIDVDVADSVGWTGLIWACLSNKKDIVELLLQHGANINKPDNCGNTPIIMASDNGHIDIVSLLIQHHADINHTDNDGGTALHCACHFGHVDTVVLLLQHGADYNITNKNNKTPLDMAKRNNKSEVVDVLTQWINEHEHNEQTEEKHEETASSPSINELQTQIQQLQHTITQQHNQIQHKDNQITQMKTNHKQIISEKDNELAEMRTELQQKDDEITQMKQQLEGFKTNHTSNSSNDDFALSFEGYTIETLAQIASALKINSNESKQEEKEEEEGKRVDFDKWGFIIQPEHVDYIDDESSLLGRGGFGDVYLGQFSNMNIAIKKLEQRYIDDEVEQDLIREAMMLSKLHHENLVRFYGLTYVNESYILVMEYMKLGGLDKYIKKNKNNQLSEDKKMKLMYDVACGLNYLHQSNILHNDIKSMNVLLKKGFNENTEEVELLAKLRLSRTTSSLARSSGKSTGVGTIRWRAPETFSRGGNKGKHSDVYSFGMLSWEIVSWKTEPYSEADDDVEAQGWIVNGDLETIPDGTNEGIKNLISRCWDEVDARPKTSDIVDTLHDMI